MKRSYDNTIRLQNKTMNIAANPKQMVYPEQSKHQNAAKPYLQQNSQLSQQTQQTHQISLNGLPQNSFHQVQNNVYGGQQFMQQQQPMVLQVPNNAAGNCQPLIQMRQPNPYEQNSVLTQIITPQGNYMVPSVYTRPSQNLAPNNNFVPQYYTISNFQQPYVINNATQSPYNMVHNQNKAMSSTYQAMQHVQQPMQEEVRKPAVTNGSDLAHVTMLEKMLANKANTQTSDALNRVMTAKIRNSVAQSTATNKPTTTFNMLSASPHMQNFSSSYPQANSYVTSGTNNLPVQTNIASIQNGNEQLRSLIQSVQSNTAQSNTAPSNTAQSNTAPSYHPLMPVMPNSSVMMPQEDVQMPISIIRGDTEANTLSTVTCGPPVEVLHNRILQQQVIYADHKQQINNQPTGQSILPISHMVNECKESRIPMALKSNVVEAIISIESAVPEEEVKISEHKEEILKEQPTIALGSTERALVVEKLEIVPKVEDKTATPDREAEKNEPAELISVTAAVQQRPDLLTHVIEGVVIQESNLPFPIRIPAKMIESEDANVKMVEVHPKVVRTPPELADHPKTQSVKPYKTTEFVTERNNNVIGKLHSDKRICMDNMSETQFIEGNKCEDQDIEIFEDKSRNNAASNNLYDVPKKQCRNSDIILKAGNMPKKAKRCEAQEWSVEEVYKFIKSIPGCEDYAEDFAEQEIDGEALFLIKTDHLMDNLAMKLGPALKVLASIQDLRPKEYVVLPQPYDNEVVLK